MKKEEQQKLKIPLPKDPEKALEMINERCDEYPVGHPEILSIIEQRGKYEKREEKYKDVKGVVK